MIKHCTVAVVHVETQTEIFWQQDAVIGPHMEERGSENENKQYVIVHCVSVLL